MNKSNVGENPTSSKGTINHNSGLNPLKEKVQESVNNCKVINQQTKEELNLYRTATNLIAPKSSKDIKKNKLTFFLFICSARTQRTKLLELGELIFSRYKLQRDKDNIVSKY